MSRVRRLLQIVLGVILIWAALGKIANLQEFLGTLLALRLPIPPPVLTGTAIILPWVELLAGAILMFDPPRIRAGLVLVAGLLGLFAVVTGQAWVRGLTISCGCFDLRFLGIAPGGFLDSTGFACLRAVVLLAIALWLLADRGMPTRRGAR
jgi:putative oxidoreductase